MTIVKKILIIVLLIVGLTALGILDYSDRTIIYSKYTPAKELKEFYLYKTIAEVKHAYEKHFQDSEYRFPRATVKKVVIYKNLPIFSRLTGKEVDKSLFLDFVNNPDNFSWNETTWSLDESEYIIRFYDHSNNEKGKIWLCLNKCGMTESIPFAPTMKFGGLSSAGKLRLLKIINDIYD
jgi:hypothetical protein